MKPFFVQTWIHEVTYQPNVPKSLPLPRNQPLLPRPHGHVPNAYGQNNPHLAQQPGTYGAQNYNANLPAGNLKSQVYFLQQELTRINGHIDQIMQQARITPSHNRQVWTAFLYQFWAVSNTSKSMLTISTLQQMKHNLGMVIGGTNQLQVSIIKGKSIAEKSDYHNDDYSDSEMP